MSDSRILGKHKQASGGQSIEPIFAKPGQAAEEAFKELNEFKFYAVMLTVQWARLDPQPLHALTFVQCTGTPHNAINLSAHIWETFMRPKNSIYPDVVGEQNFVVIDEQDFFEYYKTCLRIHKQVNDPMKCPMFIKGDPRYPMWFHAPSVKVDDFDKLKGRLVWTPEDGPVTADDQQAMTFIT